MANAKDDDKKKLKSVWNYLKIAMQYVRCHYISIDAHQCAAT